MFHSTKQGRRNEVRVDESIWWVGHSVVSYREVRKWNRFETSVIKYQIDFKWKRSKLNTKVLENALLSNLSNGGIFFSNPNGKKIQLHGYISRHRPISGYRISVNEGRISGRNRRRPRSFFQLHGRSQSDASTCSPDKQSTRRKWRQL